MEKLIRCRLGAILTYANLSSFFHACNNSFILLLVDSPTFAAYERQKQILAQLCMKPCTLASEKIENC